MGKTIGYVLLGAAAVVLILVAAVMFTPAEGRSMSASVLGFALTTAVVVLPLAAGGVFFVRRGGQEQAQQQKVQQQRKLLNIVKTQGQTQIGDAAIELDASRDEVKNMLYDLVGKGLYSGYINWDEGTLYSEQAAQLRELENCRNCGGDLDLAGKGVVRCPYCGTEYFL